MSSDWKNPFIRPNGRGSVDTQSRLYDMRRFTLDQCWAALGVPGLQKTVEQAVRRRIRKLERAGGAR